MKKAELKQEIERLNGVIEKLKLEQWEAKRVRFDNAIERHRLELTDLSARNYENQWEVFRVDMFSEKNHTITFTTIP